MCVAGSLSKSHRRLYEESLRQKLQAHVVLLGGNLLHLRLHLNSCAGPSVSALKVIVFHSCSQCVHVVLHKGAEPKPKAKARGRHVARDHSAKTQPKAAGNSCMEVFSVAESSATWTPGKKSAMDDLDFLAIQWGRPQKIQLAGVPST